MTTRSALPRINCSGTLRTYAAILRKDVRITAHDGGSFLRGAPEILWSAAEALDFAADEMEIHAQLGEVEDRHSIIITTAPK